MEQRVTTRFKVVKVMTPFMEEEETILSMVDMELILSTVEMVMILSALVLLIIMLMRPKPNL